MDDQSVAHVGDTLRLDQDVEQAAKPAVTVEEQQDPNANRLIMLDGDDAIAESLAKVVGSFYTTLRREIGLNGQDGRVTQAESFLNEASSMFTGVMLKEMQGRMAKADKVYEELMTEYRREQEQQGRTATTA